MAYSDDEFEYEDDGDYYEAEEPYLDYTEDYEDADEDDSAAARRRSSVRGSITPFSSGLSSSLPGGSSRFNLNLKRNDEDNADEEDEDLRSSLSRRMDTATNRAGVERPVGGTSGRYSSPTSRADDARYAQSGTPPSTSGRFGSTSLNRSPSPTPQSRAESLRTRTDASASDGRGNPAAVRSPGGPPAQDKPAISSASDVKKEDKAEDKGKGGGGLLGGLRRGGGSSDEKKPAAKKEDKAEDKGGGGLLGGLGLGRGSSSSDEKKDEKKPVAKKEDKAEDKGGGGGLLGGLGLGRGGSSDEKKPVAKKEDKAEDKGGGGGLLGGLGLRRGGSSSDEKKDEKKPAAKKEDKKAAAQTVGQKADAPSAGGNFFRRGREVQPDNPAAPGDKKPEVKAADKKPGPSALGKERVQEAKKQDKADKKASDAKGAAAAATAVAGVGLFGRIGGIFGGAGGDDKPAPAPRRSAQPKVPQTAGEGLTLDNYLDILGVGLVFFSLVIGFSALSAEQAAISAILDFAGQHFGWAAVAMPIGMFVVGMWLIVRHFGEEAPTVDPVRVVGLVLAFISLLVVFQYIDTFSYEIGSEEGVVGRALLETRLNISWQLYHDGGGRIGATLYYELLKLVGDPGVIIVALFVLVISGMLMTRLTASEIVMFFAGMWRSWRDGMRQRAIQRRAERQLREQQAMELAAQQAAALVQTAVAGDAPPDTLPEAAPAPTSAANEGRRIRFNRGGEVSTLTPNAANASATPPAAPAHPDGSDGGGRRFSLFGRSGTADEGQTDNGVGQAAAALAGGVIGAALSSDYEPLPMPDEPLPHDDGFSHFAPPVQPSWHTAPAQGWQPQAAPQPAPPANEEPLRRTQPPSTPQPERPFDQPVVGAEPQTEQPAAEVDPVQARQERLNALRKGQTGPLSQTRLAQVRQNAPSLQPVIVSRGDNVDVGDLPDEQDVTPASQLPSAQPNGQSAPYQQRLAAAPAQPLSSKVTNQTRAQRPVWRTPDYRTLLSSGSEQEFDREALLRQAKIIEDTLQSFGAPGRVVEVNTGPVITQFGVEPDYIEGRGGKKQRVKVSAIAALDKDLQLALGARSIRVEAPVPGKGYVGVEVPNAESTLVSLRDVMDSPGFQKHKTPLAIALGQSVSGAPVSADLASMPHLLIAGTTGSGKSVCVNSIITSIVSRHTPDEVKFIMVDPKRVELIGYNGIPHLVAPVVVELERIVGVLKWVTREMDDRYKQFSAAGARNIVDFNQHRDPLTADPMPYIVVIIDELADLMMMAPEETERTITRIAALARATGIHLVIATQRPSADVVTGLIKANFPARIAFAVASNTDSRVILDQPGAERLLGKGDMLYMSGNSPAPVRLQGVYVSDMEIQNIVRYWKMMAVQQPAGAAKPQPLNIPSERPTSEPAKQQGLWDDAAADEDDDAEADFEMELTQGELTGDVQDGNEDELYEKAVELVRRLDKASISLLQRRLRIGYTRAARLIDVMEARDVIGPAKEGSSKPRDVLPE